MDGASAAALIKEKERFQALFEFASLGIIVANSTGVIEMANNFLLTQFGYTLKEDLIGRPVEMLIPRRYDHIHHKHREGYIKHPAARPMGVGRDLFGLKKDGTEFPVEVSLSNYKSGEETFVIAFVIDITLRKEIESALIEQKEELAEKNGKIEELNESLERKVELRTAQFQETMNLLEASRDELSKALSKEKELGDLKSRFVSMASHEFRTPLSTILSSASLLAKYTDNADQDKRDKHINRIKASVNNLTDILDEFLSIGKIEDGKILARYTSFNVKEFISQLVQELKALAKPGQQLVYSHSGEEIIYLDESLLRKIIFNLLTNAIKFSHDDGLIGINSTVSGSEFSLEVVDQGIGISAEDQEHLFERFFRASNATNIQGTGLGLHIIAKYAELMAGEISFNSELEKGSRFTISFNNAIV
ncbi:MAG: two-component sensor histidine kinase [Ferruginibacter sp.]|nr:two-component sensor histidine kinase [Ferruginibacter sp.]